MPEVSIIVPVYKVENYLKRCIDSILEQTCQDYELILVDDGSPDQSGVLCDQYQKKDNRIIVIHKKNGGLSSARNAGLDIASGRYITFVDSDDWIPEDALEHLLYTIKKYNADLSMGELIRTKAGEKTVKTVPQCSHTDVYDVDQFWEKFFKAGSQKTVHYACNKLFLANTLTGNRFPEGLIAEDVQWVFGVLLNCKTIAVSDKITYYYFYNIDSITNSYFSVREFDLLKIWDNVSAMAKQHNCDKRILYYAKMNRYRADFGLLTKMAVFKVNDQDKKKIRRYRKCLLKDFRKNYYSLIRFPCPINRKLLMTCFYINYPISYFAIKSVQLIRSIYQNGKNFICGFRSHGFRRN